MLNFPDLRYVSFYIHLTFKDVNNLQSFSQLLFPPLPRPSGVVLMRPDYYTIPHLDEIDSLESEGQCVVEGFTIGRRGFGEVHFPGKTDVHGMNLDELGVCLSVCQNYVEVLGSHVSLPFFGLTVLSNESSFHFYPQPHTCSIHWTQGGISVP